MSKPKKSWFDKEIEEQNAKALQMAAQGVPLVRVPRPKGKKGSGKVSKESLKQRKARAFDWLTQKKLMLIHGYAYNPDRWGVCDKNWTHQGNGATPLEAVEDAMAKEGKGL